MKKLTISFWRALFVAALPALAQPAPDPNLPKFPTPAPALNAETSVIRPPYADAPEYQVNPSVPQGDVHEFIMYSEDSKIYPGIVRIEGDLANKRDEYGNRLPFPAEQLSKPGRYERHVYVYIPKQVKPGAPFMVVQDGHSYINRMAPVLDNMIAAHRVPAMIIMAPDSGGSDAQGSQRGLEYDTLSDRYSNWVEQELLPAVSQKYGVSFTSDPEGRATMGGSSGAICAWTMAWYPSRALSQGAFLFRHLREPGLAPGSQDAARRLGISRHPDPQDGQEAHPHLDGSGREGPAFRRSGKDLAQLAAGQQPHGGRC